MVDLRTEWLRRPYLSFWGPDSAGYCWSLPRAGRYAAAELDTTVGYHTRRRYVPGRKAYVGRWERFAVPAAVLEGIASEPDSAGRWGLEPGGGPIVRNSVSLRKRLNALRYVPRPASAGKTRRAETEGLGAKHAHAVPSGATPVSPNPTDPTRPRGDTGRAKES